MSSAGATVVGRALNQNRRGRRSNHRIRLDWLGPSVMNRQFPLGERGRKLLSGLKLLPSRSVTTVTEDFD